MNSTDVVDKTSNKNTLNIWQKLKRKHVEGVGCPKGSPIIVLAPMADVTDIAFRSIIAKYSHFGESDGVLDVMWTEFVSADGLCSRGRDVLLRDLAYMPEHRPIIAQLFTSNPENMEKAAALVESLGFDGLDINMGCPDRSIEKQGAGAALIRNPKLAREIIRAAKRGAPNLPISVKTRVGYNKVELDTWLPEILAEEPALVTIHARTRKEMSDVPARWEHVAQAVAIRDQMFGKYEGIDAGGKNIGKAVGKTIKKAWPLIFGNGDVNTIEQARIRAHETGADGVMIGRGIFGNPWFFRDSYKPSISERLEVLVEHSLLFEKLLGDIKNFAIMKKHFKAYVNGWDGAKELRVKLMEVEGAEQVKEIIKNLQN